MLTHTHFHHVLCIKLCVVSKAPQPLWIWEAIRVRWQWLVFFVQDFPHWLEFQHSKALETRNTCGMVKFLDGWPRFDTPFLVFPVRLCILIWT